MNKLLLTTAVLLATFSIHSNAEQWEWGKRGGSPTPATNNVEETVYDIATDKWGNTYVAARSYATGMNVDGNMLTGYGSNDLIITSFRCDGTYRWSKVIGSTISDIPSSSIKTDTLGGVYVTCYLSVLSAQCNFDTDTTVNITAKRLFLVKYDTAGSYQWLRTPQDTVTINNNLTKSLDLDVDAAGNIDMFCWLYPGGYANGAYIVTDTSMNILRYNAQGNFVGGIPLPFEVTDFAQNYVRMKRDYKNGRYYFAGSAGPLITPATVSFNGNIFNNSQYVAAVNSIGQLLWLRNDNGIYTGFNGRPALDDSGNVYVTGYGWTGTSFNGYTYNSTHSSGPAVISLDSMGNNRWVKYATVNGSSLGYSIAMRNNNEVVMVGSYPGKVEWPGYAGPHPNHAGNQNYDVFITSFNAHTGAVSDVDTLGGVFGGFDEPTCIVADRNNNVYLGGRYGGNMYVGTADTLQLTGGQSDFFIVKHGYASCMPMSVNEVKGTDDIVVYPNPVTELLQIKGLQAATNFRLLSITGAVMQTGVLEQNNKGLSTEGLAPGMYLLELNGVQQKGVVRFVKQ